MAHDGVRILMRHDLNNTVEVHVREALMKEVRRLQKENHSLRRGHGVYKERQRQMWAKGRRKQCSAS